VSDTAVGSSQTSTDQAVADADQSTVLSTLDTGSGGSGSPSDQNGSTGSGSTERNTSQRGNDTSESAAVTDASTAVAEKAKDSSSLAAATEKESVQQTISGNSTTAVSVDSDDRGSVGALADVLRNLTTVDGFKKLYQKDEQLVAMLSAAIILILLLLLLVLRRKRLTSPDNTPSGTTSIVMPAVTGEQDTVSSDQQSADVEPREESNARPEKPAIAQQSDDTSTDGGKAADPISEAVIYLTYGHHDQAEGVLTSAILREPTRTDLKLKLLEVYQAQGDLEKFEQMASQLSTSLSVDSSEWVSVVQMGRAMSSNNPLVTAIPLSRHDADNEITSDSDSGTEEIGIDLELEEPGVELVTPTVGSPQDVQPDEITRSSSTDLEFSEDLIKAENQLENPADETAYGSNASDMDSSAEDPDNADSMDIGTRLDLARAYIEMGDNSAAKNMLTEVIQHGDTDQRASAQEMLTTLDNK